VAMVVTHSTEEWRTQLGAAAPRPSVFTVGNFDGVHCGHQLILQTVVASARRQSRIGGVLTFYPHPARVLRPDAAPPLLMTLDQRLRAFDAAEIDAALVLRFDTELAKVSAEDFIRRFLAPLNARRVLVGENFRFGHRGAGDVNLLRKVGELWGFDVEIVPPMKIDGAVVSSTAVRAAVREGRMEDAAKLLGRPFALEGEIRTGTGQGRKLVVPTLNLATEQECLPKNGVYVTETSVRGRLYRSVTNVGVRPTLDGTRLTIESHLFGFSEDVTSGRMEIRFRMRLRDEQKFAGPEALREQILRDIERAQHYFEVTVKTPVNQ
jgi:riboflavin kinase / FMN adenylyltransferase